jgi:hypothetical protein
VDWLSLGVLVAAPTVANFILGALSRQREYQADLEAVELTGDPAGLARAIELIEMAQKRITSSVFPGAVRIRLPRLLSSHPDLVRERHGVTHTALIHADGIEWRGQRYRSLTIVARKITGARWSGPRFFGLRRQLDSHSRAGEGDGEG